MPRLIISAPDGKKGILELSKPVTTVGRGNANDLVLNDSSVSRLHAVIKLADQAVLIADRGSTNGILVNGRKIRQESEIKSGDLVSVGRYDLRLEQLDERGIQVRRAELPSTLENLMRRTAPGLPPIEEAPSSRQDNLAARIKKLERENYLLTVLYDAGKALNTKLSLDAISEQVISLAFRIEGVERGFVMLFDESGAVARQSEVRYRNPQTSDGHRKIILSRSVLEMIKKERQPILIEDVISDRRFNLSESMKISGLRSAMCAPLLGADRLFGILYVDNMEKASAFTQEELNVFAVVAAQAGAAVDNAMAHEKIALQAQQRSALERFLSPEVAEMVVANPDLRLGGVNQKVTVMFADIRGFTPMSEGLEPGRVVEILNEYFTRVTEVIFDSGVLDKYIGDAVMAVFGAPISKGNDAANAVQAAIQIQRLLIELNRDAAARHWPELRVGIGISTGIVTAGNIGSPRRLDYTVIGDTVNIASRLMSNAAGGQILISRATADDSGREFDLQSLPPLRVKGRNELVEVFDVAWENPASQTTKASPES
jgi:class 3 adenylate cyclase